MKQDSIKKLPERKLTEAELSRAYHNWYRHYDFAQDDVDLTPYLNEEIKAYHPGQESWIRRARRALFYSTNSLAAKLGVDRQVFSSYETGEERGSISLATLAKAAESMGCELVYAIRPKAGVSFSKVIWAQLLARALRHPWVHRVNSKVNFSSAATARDLMAEPP